MTGQITSASSFGPLIGDASTGYALISTGATQRSIGDIFPHVTVEEVHHDELQITQHPVETGAPVTDHAFMQPYTIEMHCGWSNSTAATEGYVQAVYQALLALQRSRTPFNVSTGKRSYSSMLMRSLMIHTDPESEYALMVVAVCQQIIITGTQTLTASASDISGGSAQVGSTVPNNPTGPPSFPVTNSVAVDGTGTAYPEGTFATNASGDATWSNSAPTSGLQNLVPATNGPTVESLTANGGV